MMLFTRMSTATKFLKIVWYFQCLQVCLLKSFYYLWRFATSPTSKVEAYRRNHFIVNWCPMCLRDEETVHHLLIHRVFAYSVWITLIARLDMQWVMPWSVEDLFQQWFFRC